MKSKNSAPETLCIICGGRSPSSMAEPMKLALKPIMRTSGVSGSPRWRASGMATGANMRITTTLSTTIDTRPESIDRITMSMPPLPRESSRAFTESHSGIPDLPK